MFTNVENYIYIRIYVFIASAGSGQKQVVTYGRVDADRVFISPGDVRFSVFDNPGGHSQFGGAPVHRIICIDIRKC